MIVSLRFRTFPAFVAARRITQPHRPNAFCVPYWSGPEKRHAKISITVGFTVLRLGKAIPPYATRRRERFIGCAMCATSDNLAVGDRCWFYTYYVPSLVSASHAYNIHSHLVEQLALQIELHNIEACWGLPTMKLRDIFLAAAIPSATALHQSVVAHSAGAVELTPPGSANEGTDNSSFTETIVKAPPPLKTAVSDKPAVGASVMGLVVFSAAGLVLL
ncbi:hypothetical protein CHU98_g5177 [Xylaria longipes]|nr:hypothetical protein CHU98_g5177 [Xylaria longipes]